MLPGLAALEILCDNKAVQKKVEEQLATLKKELHVKLAGFAACEAGFNAHAFAKAIVDAELDLEKTRSTKKGPSRTPKDASHPELYERLNQWRATTATEKELERYSIMTTRSLLEIVEVLPTSMTALRNITGIGKVRAEKYGPEILALVLDYSADHQLPTDQLQFATGKAPKAPKPPKPDTKVLTFDLYKAGKTVAEIAEERGLVSSTIESHLSHFVGTGELDVYAFVDAQKVATIEAYFAQADNTSFSEAKQALGDAVTYGEMRLVLSHIKSKTP